MKPLTASHSISITELVERLETDIHRGLDGQEVAQRLARWGANRLAQRAGVSKLRRLASQFQSLIVGLLLVSAIVAGVLGEWIDSVVIMAIVILNGVLGFLKEQRAEDALAALRKMSSPKALVRRGGKTQSIDASQIVVGDILELDAGVNVAADARLLTSYGLQVMEASLTGESVPSEKSHLDRLPADTLLGDRRNMVFAGTSVTTGRATAIVTATGMATEIGSIADLLQQTDTEQTPLQLRLAEMGRLIVVGCLIIVSIIFLLQWLRGGELIEVFLTSVSLAVAAVPEGLPAIVTIALAIGLSRMAKKNAIIRRLTSVETLGCVSVICTDKTGTLTSNEMTVTELRIPGAYFGVSGSGYTPKGRVVLEHADSSPNEEHAAASSIESRLEKAEGDLAWLLRVGALCNNARWSWNESTQRAETIGDPTEIALLVAASKVKQATTALQVELLHENSFDSDRKMMSQIYRLPDEAIVLVAKGAPEVIVSRATRIRQKGCERDLNEDDKRKIAKDNMEMADRALRVLALAYHPIDNKSFDYADESSLTFLGLVGMMDPPRQEVKDAVARCASAGIRPIMITGDHPGTAMAIAGTLGIADHKEALITGLELQAMSDELLQEKIHDFSVFARVSAEHKLRVVNAWRARGHVVAMTGDGLNDAPAVKAANIGIVMGITGTDVAKEASDMILTDDNFATIVNAVEEGRGIYENIQKVFHYLLACNASEVIFMFVSSLIGWPAPLLPIHILWINLVTDGMPALSLATEPLEKQLMLRRPRSPQEAFLKSRRIAAIALQGSLMAFVALVAFGLYPHDATGDLATARTAAFCTIALTQIFFAMGCRSFDKTMPQVGPFSNPGLVWATIGSALFQIAIVSIAWFSGFLNTTPLAAIDWLWIIGLSLLPVTVVECFKLAWPTVRHAHRFAAS